MEFDPDLHLSRLYINPRARPVIWGMDDEVDNFCPGGTREPRYAFAPASRVVSRGRDRPLRGRDLTSQQAEAVSDYGRGSGRATVGRERDDSLPFTLAVAELFRQLEAATAFYIAFGKEYSDDIKKIKQYATREILENLWIRKVRRAKNPTGESQNQDEGRYAGTGFPDYEDQFAIWKRKVCHALDGAIASSLDTGNSNDRSGGARQQSMARMIDKIRTAHRQLLPLLGAAWKREQVCRDLVTELKLLRDLVNPGQTITRTQTNQDSGGEVVAVSNDEVAEEVKVGGVDW
jgi:hypothetical protein